MRQQSALLAALVLFLSFSAFAQTGKITKAKGGKAVVDFGATTVREGQQVMISNGDDMGMESGMGKGGGGGQLGRQHGISYGFEFSSSSSNGNNSTGMGLDVDYLYNLGTWEFGAIFGYSTSDNGTAKSTNMSIGPQARYNFTENKKGKTLIPYAGVGLTMDTNDVGGTSTSGMTMFAEGGVNWFPWAQIFAVNGGLKLGSTSRDVGGTKVNSSNMSLFAGWTVYFQ